MSVSVKGIVTITGKLADHTAITASAPLSKTNQWLVFAQLYTLKGSIAGMAALTDAAAGVDDVTGTLTWFRPQQNVQWYPYGWSDGITVGLLGARYIVPATGSVFPSLQAIVPNATLDFSSGLLAAPVTNNITISATNVVTGATMLITKASGLITGTFTHSDGTKPAYQGVIIRKGTSTGAHGYFMTRATPLNYLGESGAVDVTAK